MLRFKKKGDHKEKFYTYKNKFHIYILLYIYIYFCIYIFFYIYIYIIVVNYWWNKFKDFSLSSILKTKNRRR